MSSASDHAGESSPPDNEFSTLNMFDAFDTVMTPAQQDIKGKLKGAGGGALEETLTEAKGPATARMSMCFVLQGPGRDVCGGCVGSDGCRSVVKSGLTRCDKTSHVYRGASESRFVDFWCIFETFTQDGDGLSRVDRDAQDK